MGYDNLLAGDNLQVIKFNPKEPVRIGLDGTVRNILAGPLRLFGYAIHNQDAARGYVQIFFVPASQVVLGTTSPDIVLEMAASRSDRDFFPYPFDSTAGMSAASTTGPCNSTGATVDTEAYFFVKKPGG